MYSSYCRSSLLCIEILCVCSLWIINVSQYSAMPSALTQRTGRLVPSIDIHTFNRRSPNGIDSDTGLSRGAEFVLFCFWTGLVSTFRPHFPVGPIRGQYYILPVQTESFLHGWPVCSMFLPKCHWFLLEMFNTWVWYHCPQLPSAEAMPNPGWDLHRTTISVSWNRKTPRLSLASMKVKKKSAFWWHWNYSIWYTQSAFVHSRLCSGLITHKWSVASQIRCC